MGCARDKYADFAELAANEAQCADWSPGKNCSYSIRTSTPKSGSSCLVMAIHGGRIESGTDMLAERFDSDCNTYEFKGAHWTQHICSTHFDEPKLMALIGVSTACVSFHGMGLATEKMASDGNKPSMW